MPGLSNHTHPLLGKILKKYRREYQDIGKFPKIGKWPALRFFARSEATDLKPPQQPPGFNNRLNAIWKLLLQIAQHAGGGLARAGMSVRDLPLSRSYEPSVGVQLLAVLRSIFTKNRTEIT